MVNRVLKIASVTSEVGINWNYCPTTKNLADLGSRGAGVTKLEKGEWFDGPDWLLNKESWPEQPKLKCSREVDEEHKPFKENPFYSEKRSPDEWTTLLTKNKFWRTLRITAWVLRFVNNSSASHRKLKKQRGPLTTEEITRAKSYLWQESMFGSGGGTSMFTA